MISRVLVDMDEVLVDFTGGALRVHGVEREKFQRGRRLGEWDVTKHLGMTHEEFWRPLTELGEIFWMGLQPLPWARALVEVLQEYDWYIVSSPAWEPSSVSGKVRWLRRFFGHDFDSYVLTQHKELLANSSTLLIDDRTTTIDRFRDAGGVVILFPSLGNALHRMADEPVTYVKELLDAQNIQKCQRCLS